MLYIIILTCQLYVTIAFSNEKDVILLSDMYSLTVIVLLFFMINHIHNFRSVYMGILEEPSFWFLL